MLSNAAVSWGVGVGGVGTSLSSDIIFTAESVSGSQYSGEQYVLSPHFFNPVFGLASPIFHVFLTFFRTTEVYEKLIFHTIKHEIML